MNLGKPMSVFEHFVARCTIAHQEAIRAARAGDDKETSRRTIALIGKLHRLETLYNEMGGGAVFGRPDNPLGADEVERLLP